MIINLSTGKEAQKLGKIITTSEDHVENNRGMTITQEMDVASSNITKPCLGSLSLKQQGEKCTRILWKDRLLGRAHSSSSIPDKIDDPDVRILSLSIICPGRSEIILKHPFVSNPKASLFTLKEGTKYQLKFSFMVYNNAVSGLQYTNTLWKAGVRVDRCKLNLGNYSPRKEPYGYKQEEGIIPSGILIRGTYSARIKVVDDAGKCYLDIQYYFDIRKNWPTSS